MEQQQTFIEATEVHKAADVPAVNVQRFVGPFYMGFAYRYEGQVVTAEELEKYILERHGIGCSVLPKDDGVVITTNDMRSVNTLAREIRFSHDYVIGHLVGPGNCYQIYVRAERKKPQLRIGI